MTKGVALLLGEPYLPPHNMGRCSLGGAGAEWPGCLTWHIDVHGHDAVTAPHDGVGVVVVAASIGTAGGKVP